KGFFLCRQSTNDRSRPFLPPPPIPSVGEGASRHRTRPASAAASHHAPENDKSPSRPADKFPHSPASNLLPRWSDAQASAREKPDRKRGNRYRRARRSRNPTS